MLKIISKFSSSTSSIFYALLMQLSEAGKGGTWACFGTDHTYTVAASILNISPLSDMSVQLYIVFDKEKLRAHLLTFRAFLGNWITATEGAVLFRFQLPTADIDVKGLGPVDSFLHGPLTVFIPRDKNPESNIFTDLGETFPLNGRPVPTLFYAFPAPDIT